MSTFLIKSEKQITRQEGDDCDIVFTIPAIFPLTGATVIFSVFRSNGANIISKTTGIDITDQVITVTLLPADTTAKAGQHRWELQITKDSKITTIGKGAFIITPELIK